MTFADRLKISSIMSFSLLVIVAVLLVWSSGELSCARDNDILADDIQTIIFQRATLRDEYFLYGVERARLQWFALSRDTAELLRRGVGQFNGTEDRHVLEKVQADFNESLVVSGRLVEQVQLVSVKERAMVHHHEFASRLYSQVMLKDSALQQGSTALQRLTRERFNQANGRTIALTIALVLLTVAGTVINSSFINRLLRRRLTTLKDGAALIAAGDLGYRIDCRGSDELVELGRVFNQMTERVQDYTKQLQKSHDLLNDLSSQVPGILFQACLSSGGVFSTPYVSRGVNDIFETVPGKTAQPPAAVFKSFRPDDDQGIFASFLQSARTLQPWQHEYRITVPSHGSTKWLRGHARPMRLEDGGTLWHGFISDVTERRLMEEALQVSEERFRLQLQELTNIYTHTPAGLFAVDLELRFLRLNERMAEINGRPIEEHLGRTINEALPADLAAKLRDIWRPVLEQGESLFNIELQGAVCSSPDTRHWLASYQPLLTDTGTVSGLMGSVLDITDRKQVEHILSDAREQLEQEVLHRTAKFSLANEQLIQEIEVRKKVEVELLDQQQKLQNMALDLSMAEERERHRIAGELHDQVGQRLILAKIKLDSLASKLPSGECETEAGGIETLIDQTIQDIRSLTFQIRPPLLTSVGLEAALRWLGEELRADFGLDVEFSDDGNDKPLRYEIRSTLFQAVRELMLNVVKHAGTMRCHVGFTRADRCIVIVVDDDGVGFKTGPPDEGSARSGGFGLLNVKQKIEYVGGIFAIEAKAAGGTRATIQVPLEPAG